MNTGGTDQQPSGHSGQIMIMFALALIAILGFAALAVDVGFLLAERRGVQNAADAAAMATARMVLREDTAQLQSQGEQFAAGNGYPDATTEVTWPYQGSNELVHVEVTHDDVDRFFLGALYDGDWAVSAEAVARVKLQSNPFAVIALGEDEDCTNTPGGILFNGVVNPKGGIYTHGGGIYSNGGIRFNGPSRGLIDGNVEAHCDIGSSSNFRTTEKGMTLPTQGTIEDPLADFADQNDPMNSADCQNENPGLDENGNLQPGLYTSEPDGMPKGNGHLEFNPGIYCFQTELSTNGKVTLGGDGVLLYFDGPDGKLDLGQGRYHFSSIGSEWENVVLWFADCANGYTLTGQADSVLDGSVYAPCSKVELKGTAATTVYGQLIAHEIEINGTPNFTFHYTADDDPTPLRVFLVQ